MAAAGDARRSSKWSPLGLALLCAHCGVGALVAGLGAVGFLSTPVLFGVDWNYVWPPVAILGAFGVWLWSGREKEGAACAPPPAGESER